MTVQPIAGVSSRTESVVMTEYPSISAGWLGKALGDLYECLPIPIFGVKLSNLLFTLPTAPIAVLLYLLQKVTGEYFVLTNRSVQVWAARSGRRIATVELGKIADVEVHQASGQRFYKAGDIVLRGASGEILARLEGIPDAPSFSNAIQRTAESRRLVQSAMDVIEARA